MTTPVEISQIQEYLLEKQKEFHLLHYYDKLHLDAICYEQIISILESAERNICAAIVNFQDRRDKIKEKPRSPHDEFT